MTLTFFSDVANPSWTMGSLLDNHTFVTLATVLLPFYGGALTAVAIGLVGRHLLGVEFGKSVILTVIALVFYYLVHMAAFGLLLPY